MADALAEVQAMLREGYGAEDIALALDLDVAAIRAAIRFWQKSGEIRAILKPGNEAADERIHPRAGLTETPREKDMGNGCF